MNKPGRFRFLRDHIAIIPGENPSQASLLGSNVYLVGHKAQAERIMIDTGEFPPRNEGFLNNLKAFFAASSSSVFVSKILLTHGHHDHIGGVPDVVKYLASRQPKAPQVFKMLDGNRFETSAFEKDPTMGPAEANSEIPINHIAEGDKFILEAESNEAPRLSLSAMHTPGHISDHMSFLLEGAAETVLFSGDIILGSPSTVLQDFPTYMDTLYSLRKVAFDKVCVPHSVSLEFEGISDEEFVRQFMMDGHPKLEAYIKYREERIEQLASAIEKRGTGSKDELYEDLYGERNLEGKIRMMAYFNLDQQLEYLLKSGRITEKGDDVFSMNQGKL